MKSDVYFIEVTSSDTKDRCLAVEKLINKANPFSRYQKDEFIPVKLTIGDSPCVYNLSPELVKNIISKIKKQGAKPFLFDTSVIYKGQRQNAVDHLTLAQNKGFGYTKVSAPFIIADGLLGQDGREFEVDSGDIKKIRVPSFVGMLDSLLVLTHVTGHIVAVYAGAIKNVAMGMSCRATKQVQHSSLKPKVLEEKCTSCGCCIAICPVKAISFIVQESIPLVFLENKAGGQEKNFPMPLRESPRAIAEGDFLENKKANINQSLCIGCGECLCACKFDAILINWHESPHTFVKRMVEVANFILSKFKNKFFINFAFDITKECDCISTKTETMIARNTGILASYDILSLERATLELIDGPGQSPFLQKSKDVYEEMLKYGTRRGLGNPEYNLIRL